MSLYAALLYLFHIRYTTAPTKASISRIVPAVPTIAMPTGIEQDAIRDGDTSKINNVFLYVCIEMKKSYFGNIFTRLRINLSSL